MSVKDGRIIAAARAGLRNNPYPNVQKLTCEVREGRLIIQGRVSSFFEKQQAQEAIRRIPGITRIVNEVTVRS